MLLLEIRQDQILIQGFSPRMLVCLDQVMIRVVHAMHTLTFASLDLVLPQKRRVCGTTQEQHHHDLLPRQVQVAKTTPLVHWINYG